eukprot:8744569-Pyramimonas_sp.AAC.1
MEVRQVQHAWELSRLFGAWPPSSFKKLDPPVQERFWKEAKEKACKDHLDKLFVQTLTKSRIEQEVAQSGGECQPLSVYKTRGFDAKAIEEKCKDTEQHKVLGTCYRVDTRSVFSKTIEQLARAEVNELKFTAKKTKAAPPSAAGSGASSGSTSKGKKGKHDKSKRDKKDKRDNTEKKDKRSRGKKDKKSKMRSTSRSASEDSA